MKKSIKTLALALAALGLVTGCTVNGNSSNPASSASGSDSSSQSQSSSDSSSSSSSSSEARPTDWSDANKAIMAENLHGIILPFIDKDGLTVALETNGWVTIKGADVVEAELKAYEAQFTTQAGYEDITSEYEDIDDGSFMAFRKSASTDQGTRYIDVLVYAENGTNYALNGAFHVEAKDTYEYSYPDVSLLWAKYPLLTPYEIPSLDLPDGGFYYIAEGSNNATAYSMGANYYYPYMTLICWGYNASEETFATFQAKFASWTVTSSEGVYTAKKNVDAEKRAVVSFSYSASERIIRYTAYLGLETIPVWPAAAASSLIQKLAPGSETVLPECPGGEKYTVYTTLNEIDVKGPETLKDAYKAILLAANWTEQEAGVYKFISPAQDILVSLSWNSSYGLEISLEAYTVPAAVWPADDIAALLGNEITDTVPAFTGENSGFTVLDDEYGTAVMVNVTSGTEEAAITAYQAVLTGAGYTELVADSSGDMQYVSPNNQILVCAYMGTSGSITILFAPAPYLAWPAVDVATLLGAATDVLPAANGAIYYEIAEGTTYFSIYAYFAAATDAQTALTTYQAALLTAKFTEAGEDSSGDMHYTSENSQFEVCPYVSGARLIIYVELPKPTEWPAAGIAAFLAEQGFTDPIPAATGGLSYDYYLSWGDPQIAVEYADADAAAAACTAYQAALVTAGFVEDGDYYGDPKYDSPNQQFEICPWVSGAYLVIDIAESF